MGAGPTGGPKDEKAPIMQIDESTENFQTNFKKQDIELVFNEYVDLKDVFKEVIISPPLQKRWNLTKKLKTVKFEFDENEELRPDATYTINFGASVADYTAGNKVDDLRFVFSTGDFIDSMEVSGNIFNALTGKPEKDVLLLLFDNLADSVVRTEKPFYFARTDVKGDYKIQNVKADTFKVFAIKDEGQQYFFDSETELIGFPDSMITLTNPKEIIPPISIFLERPSVRLTPPKNKQFGRIALKFNQEPYDVKVTHEDIGQNVFYENEQDSIIVWYDQADTSSWNIFVEQGDEFRDTFLVMPPEKDIFLKNDSLKRADVRKAEFIRVNPTKEVRISFNHPIEKVDTNLVILLLDSIPTGKVPKLEIKEKELIIKHRWIEDSSYQLVVLPNAVTDMFQMQNQDTIKQAYNILAKKAFGDLLLRVTDLDSSQHYVINLYIKDNTNLVESVPVSGITLYEKNYKTIPAGQYIIEVITDRNKNGRWDTGNYDNQSQPEALISKKLDALRENWELKGELSLKLERNE